LVEQRIENPRVRGSIPRQATKTTSLCIRHGAEAFLYAQGIAGAAIAPKLLARLSAQAIMLACVGPVAQLVEQRIENPRVRGSIPRQATKRILKPILCDGLFCV
jgi:hypothetical protein